MYVGDMCCIVTIHTEYSLAGGGGGGGFPLPSLTINGLVGLLLLLLCDHSLPLE